MAPWVSPNEKHQPHTALHEGAPEHTEEAAAVAVAAAPAPNLHYDTLHFRMPTCSLEMRTALLAQPGGFYASHWSERRIPVSIERSREALLGISKPYHELLFDSKLKTLVRHGIPASIRPTMWYFLSGGYALQVSAVQDDLFNLLSASVEGVDDATINSIEDGIEGLCQTYKSQAFADNLVLQTGKGSEALTHIMYAILAHCKDLQYSRALHQLAAFLLVVFGANRSEQAFWTLVGLIRKKLFPYAQGEVSYGNFVEKGVLELLVQKKFPKLSAHLAKMGLTLASITHGWFSTLFTSNLQPEVAVRVWDAMMSEGNKVLHRVALALIKRFETVLMAAKDIDSLRRRLDLQLSQIVDKNALMQAAFHGVGSMPSKLLSNYRDQVLAGSAYASFKQLHAATTDLHLESSPTFTIISVLNPSIGRKGLLGRTVARLSHGSEDGSGHSMYARMMSGDSVGGRRLSNASYCSDGYYSEDLGQSQDSKPKGRKLNSRGTARSATRHVHWSEAPVGLDPCFFVGVSDAAGEDLFARRSLDVSMILPDGDEADVTVEAEHVEPFATCINS